MGAMGGVPPLPPPPYELHGLYPNFRTQGKGGGGLWWGGTVIFGGGVFYFNLGGGNDCVSLWGGASFGGGFTGFAPLLILIDPHSWPPPPQI